MADFIIERVQEQKLRATAEAEAWDSLCTLLTEHPSLIEKLHDILLDPASNGIPNPERMSPARRPDLAQWQRVRAYLLANGNEWRNFRQIEEGTGLARTSVQWALYTSKQSIFFEKMEDPKRKRKMWWRVKDEYVDDASVEQPEPPESHKVSPTRPRPKTAPPKPASRAEGDSTSKPSMRKSKYGGRVVEAPERPVARPKSKYAPANSVQMEESEQ
jgi:hypothetical protein